MDYDKDDGKVLLISRYLMQLSKNYDEGYGLRYNDKEIDITWENCSLRSRLNSDFYNKAFSNSERKLINKSLIINEDNDEYATAGGNGTEDYVFLLSLSEVDKYFEAEKRLDDAISRICSHKDGYVEEWWLRSPGDSGRDAAYVDGHGHISAFGSYVTSLYGVRPALWLNLNP